MKLKKVALSFRDKVSTTWTIIFLSTVCLVYIAPFFNTTLYLCDEGAVVTPAYLVCQGKIPYRDFWSYYGVGQPYLVAFLFRIFGFELIVGRIVGLVSIIVVVICCFFILRRLLSFYWLVLWGTVLILLWFGRTGFEGSRPFAWITGLAIALLAVLNFMNALERKSTIHFFLSGCFGGLAFLFRQDIGSYFFITVFLLWAGDFLICRHRGDKRVLSPNILGVFAIGFLLLTIPLIYIVVSYTGFSVLIRDLFLFPMTVFPKARGLPYPPLLGALQGISLKGFNWLWATRVVTVFTLFYLFRIVLVLFAIWLIVHLTRTSWSIQSAQYSIIFLFAVLAVKQVAVRSDEMHGLFVVALPLMLMVVLIDRCWEHVARKSQEGHRFLLLRGCVILFLAILTIKPAVDWVILTEGRLQFVPVGLRGCTGIKVRSEAKARLLQNLVAAIQKRTRSSDRIFIGLTTHERIFVNDILVYFLARRLPGTYYVELCPGSADSFKVQNRIIGDLEKNKVDLLVLNREFEQELEPNLSCIPGSTKLDEYIAKNFHLVETLDPCYYSIYLRNRAHGKS